MQGIFLKENNQRSLGHNRNLRQVTQALACVAGELAGMPVCAFADSSQFDIGAQPLSLVLKSFAIQAHMQVFHANSVEQSERSNPERGASCAF